MSLFSSGKEWYEYVKVQYEIKKDLEESHNLVIFPLPNLYYDTVEKKKKIKELVLHIAAGKLIA